MCAPSSAKYAWPRTSDRVRLHSLGMLFYARGFAALLVVSMGQVVVYQAEAIAQVGAARAIGEGVLHVIALALLVPLLWFRRKVYATRVGLEIATFKKRRVVPWAQVIDIRELPWIRQNPPFYPKMWQVDLVGGEAFDFAGVRQAREIVASFVLD